MCPEVIQGVPYDQKVTTCVKQNLKTSEDNESDQKKKLKCFIVIARLTSLSSLRKTKENRREIQV